MTADSGGDVIERVAALEARLDELQEAVETITHRDVPLLKGTVRAVIGEEIETIDELPAAGRTFNRRTEDAAERVAELEQQVAALGDIGNETSSKDEKCAAILAFAENKHDGREKVAVSAAEIKGCTGVSRRYAYDLMEAMAAECAGVRLREARQVRTGNGVQQKKKALLVDCETVHESAEAVNQFTTGGEVTPGGE